MKICITSTGSDLSSFLDPRFGRARYFLILDSATSKLEEVIENPNINAPRGAGVASAQIVAASGAKIVITGNIGPNAFMVLNSAGIKIFSGAFGMTVKQALEAYKAGKLKETGQPTSPGFFGRPGGRFPGGPPGPTTPPGPGRGRGRGRR